MSEPKLKYVTTATTPTAQVVDDAARVVTVTDARGRTIDLRKPPFMYRIWEIPYIIKEFKDESERTGKTQMAEMVAYVVAIDGDAVALPKNDIMVKATLSRLDEAGVMAVLEGIKLNFTQAGTEEEQKNVSVQ